jgi:3-oxoacyl-[acyl-carrier protein] reductase
MLFAMKLTDKTAVVTGASRGLGRATAIELARAGAKVVVNYRVNETAAKETARQVSELGAEAVIVQADVTSESAIENLYAQTIDAFGSADIVVNNAGYIFRPAGWDTQSEELIFRTLSLDLVSVMTMTKQFAPDMIRAGWGRIVNITSTYAMTGAAPVAAYTAAKAGVISYTYAMARELGAHGITVNAVAPGNIDTDLTRESGKEVNDWAVSTTPLGRLGKPSEVGEAVLYLVGADFVTGHVLTVDGGQLLNM